MSVGGRSFFRGTDAELFNGTQVFSALISGAPTEYGLVAGQATAYDALSGAYTSAYVTATTPETRTKSSVAAKDAARRSLIEMAQVLTKVIYNTSTVTDAMLIDLGLALRPQRTPVPAPTDAPELDVVSVVGRTVKVRAHGGVLHRGKPEGISQITAFTFLGETPPETTAGWNLQGTSGRTELTITFPAGDATTAWVTAFWQNAKGQYGPACQPIQINLPASASVPSTEALKLAA